MEDIALESAKLIAIDQVSELVINQLRSEGVYSLDTVRIIDEYVAGVITKWH
jgi:hypothetical protein